MNDYYSFTTEYGRSDEFFQAVLSLDKPRVERLKANGKTLTENVKQTLVNGGGSMVSNKPAAPFWYHYLSDLEHIGKEDFVYISRIFFEETGAPLYYSDTLVGSIGKYFYNTAVFVCLTECYDLKKLNKKKTLEELVRKNRVDLLEVCAKCGWLRQAKKRDELIEYANAQNKPECTAWLLEFKNFTADLSAEQKRADKKAERELNAAPDSALELGKLWSWKKQEDGTLMITSYKGEQAEVVVPVKIGNNSVTAIADYALSPIAPKLKEPYISRREQITKITVPSGIRSIGECAFGGSGINTQWHRAKSRLMELMLPDTLEVFNDKEIAEAAPTVLGNRDTTAVIPNSKIAKYYCIKNNIVYRFTDSKELHIPTDEIIMSDKLLSAILEADKEKVTELKENGTTLTDYIKDCLLHEKFYSSVLRSVRDELYEQVFKTNGKNRAFILSSLKAEIGEPLYYKLYYNRYKFTSNFTPELFDCILEYFNTKFLNKTQEMQRFINSEEMEHLAVCAKHGWLKNAATRDKMIQYSSDNGKTECTAWLLDFKNRTTTPEAERKRAEKRLERQLNAPPKTAEDLRRQAEKAFRRMFEFEVTDGEVVITGYKGKLTEVEIPSVFEGRPVTAIGDNAFYPSAKFVSTNHRKNRSAVTKVVLPDTVRSIGTFAFLGGSIREAVIPASVKSIGRNAFLTKTTVTATVERGSYAENYCVKNNIPYRYKEDK